MCVDLTAAARILILTWKYKIDLNIFLALIVHNKPVGEQESWTQKCLQFWLCPQQCPPITYLTLNLDTKIYTWYECWVQMLSIYGFLSSKSLHTAQITV